MSLVPYISKEWYFYTKPVNLTDEWRITLWAKQTFNNKVIRASTDKPNGLIVMHSRLMKKPSLALL